MIPFEHIAAYWLAQFNATGHVEYYQSYLYYSAVSWEPQP
jgi:hypothetical protein